jgi:hypothetical protein
MLPGQGMGMGETDRSDRFAADARDLVITQCVFCRRRGGDRPGPGCEAFPAGIPDAILTNRADHRRPYSGDGGIRFEPRDEVPPEALARLYGALDALQPGPPGAA